MQQPAPEVIAAAAIDACRTNLNSFLIRCMSILEPSRTFIEEPYLEVLCHEVQQALSGDQRQLLITLPPRSLKSTLISVIGPIWKLGRDPDHRIVVATYADDLSTDLDRKSRMLFNHPRIRRVFPELAGSQSVNHQTTTTRGGYRMAVSVQGSLTGFGADTLIFDDLLKAQSASSVTERRRVHDFFDEVAYSRLNSKTDGRMIAATQRLHEDDFAAHLMRKGTFRTVTMPAIAEKDECWSLPGGRTWRRSTGDPLSPGRESLKTLRAIERQVGRVVFSAQYQQQPVPPGGARVRWERLHFYDTASPPKTFVLKVQSWDTASSTEPRADFSVCTTWGYDGNNWYLLDIWRGKRVYPDLVTKADRHARQHEPTYILVEDDTGIGRALKEDLVRRGHRRVRELRPKGSKEDRFDAQIGRLENGNVLFPRDAEWMDEFRREMSAFPNGKHDDQVDSVVQFLTWLTGPGGRRAMSINPETGRQRRPTRPNRPRRSATASFRRSTSYIGGVDAVERKFGGLRLL